MTFSYAPLWQRTLNRWTQATLLCTTVCVAAVQADVVDQSAQTSPIEELVVEASRLSQQSTEMGSSVHVMTAEDIQRMGYDFLIDVLASAPGVTVNQNGAFGGSATLRIRGAASEQTLVLVDGVTVNDPSSPGSGFNFARLDPENIERVEILKGPQSTLWGSDAIGGVVSITTKRPQPGLGGGVFFEQGSFSTSRGGGEISVANQWADFRLGLQHTDSDGISKADENNGNDEEDGYKSTVINFSGGLNLPRDITLDLSVLSTDADTEFDSFASGAQGSVGDGDELSKTDELNTQLSLNVPLLDGRLLNTFIAGYTDIERRNFSGGVASFSADGERQLWRYQGQFKINDAHKLGFGAEREENEANDNDSTIDGIYGLYEVRPLEALTLTFGLRSDDIENVGRETTGRVAAAYQLSDQVTLRGSWGEGFKAPTLFQQTFFCCGAVAPNENLQPEESDAFDVGLDWRSNNGEHYVSLTYFDQDTKNLINFSFAAGGYENIAQTESKGAELSFGYGVNQWLRLDGSYGYTDATDDSGAPLLRVPEHSGEVQLTMNPIPDLRVSLLARYNGEEQDRAVEVADWWRVDVAANYQIAPRVEVFARIENLFDEEYQQILGYGTPGLSGSAGVRLRF